MKLDLGPLKITERAHVSPHEPHVLVGYSRRTNLPSFLTRAMTSGARWSHCAPYDWQRGEFIEALMFKGVVTTDQAAWAERYPSYELIRVRCPRPLDALAFWRDQVHKGYDYFGAVGVPWRANWQDENRWYCSELFERGVAVGGNPRFFLGKHGISPHESWNVQ